MYTKANLDSMNQQLKKRRAAVLCIAAVPCILLILNLLIFRFPFLTYLLFCIAGCILIFGLDFFVKPVKKYTSYIDQALNGRNHDAELIFLRFEDETVEREGVTVWPVMFSAGNPKDEKDDRLYYFDARIEKPLWKPEETVHFTFHDKYISSWSYAKS